MTTNTVKQAIAKSAEGYPLLGWIVYWSTSGFREEVAKIKYVLHTLGIDEDYAGLVAPSTALQAAFDSRASGNVKKHSVRGEKQTIVALVKGSASGANVLFDAVTKGYLMGDNAHVEGEGAAEILDEFHTRKNVYTNTQFVGLVKKYIAQEASSLTLRDHGGVYFIPAHKEAEFKKLCALFGSFDAATLDIVPVIDTAQAKRSVWSALTSDIETEIASLEEQLAGWDKDGDPRDGVIQRRLEQYSALKEKVEDYSMLLSGTATDLKEKLDKVASELKKKL